jgi:putative hydrolase of the HAD superfamily
MFPLDQNVRLLPGLKKRGFRLYYLSNFPLDIFDEIKSGYYFFKHFDGGLISAEVKFSKPDVGIYKTLLEKYSLIPEECLFIDDAEINITAAEAIGMKGLVTHGSLEISKEIEVALKNSKGK